MLLENLEAAIGPPVSLFLVGIEAIGQQAVTIALVRIVGLPAEFEQRQAEVGVLANGVARPPAGGLNGGSPDQAHGAVRNNGVELIALDHADVEEAGIFAVHGVVHDATFAIAMILRDRKSTRLN